MSGWRRVGASDELVEGVPVRREVAGRDLLLVRYRGIVRAFDDLCPHRGGPMHQGTIDDGCIECPLHGWAFSLETGRLRGDPAVGLDAFPVREEGDEVRVQVPTR